MTSIGNSGSKTFTIFWSWQSDTPSRFNRNFIIDCLEQAAKNLFKEYGRPIIIDRDTRGVGGSPVIVEVILEKIRRCDLFIWDASLIFEKVPSESSAQKKTPKKIRRLAPNPNVAIELGYALAVVGDRRIIGIMNTGVGGGPTALPFDLQHKRWPIQFQYSTEHVGNREYKRGIKDKLTKDLEAAIRIGLKEKKNRALSPDVNYHIANKLWHALDPKWLVDWSRYRMTIPQFEQDENFSRLQEYLNIASQPQNKYTIPTIQELHDTFLTSLKSHLSETARIMIPDGNGYILSIKRRGLLDNREYDKEYDRQLKIVRSGLEAIDKAWGEYVLELRELYPEVVV